MARETRIARAVLELSTDVAKFKTEAAIARGETAKVEEQLEKVRQRAKLMQVDLERSVRGFQGERVVQEALQMQRALQVVGGVSGLTAREMVSVARTVDEATAKLKAMGQEVPPGLTKLRTEIGALAQSQGVLLDGSTKSAGGLTSLGGVARALGPLLPVASVAGLAGGLVSLGKSAVESAGQVLDLSSKLGVSTDFIQEVRQVANQSGSSVEAFTDAAFKLGINVSKGTKDARDAVKELGLSYEDLKRQAPEEQFRRTIAALEQVESTTERNRLGQALFGQKWAEIAIAVADGYTSVAAAAVVSTREQLESLDQLGDAWQQFKDDVHASVTSALGSVVLFVRDAKAELSTLLTLDPKNLASLLGIVATGGFSPDQIAAALARAGAAARQVGKDIELSAGAAGVATRDYAAEVSALDAALKALTPEQVRQLNAAIALGSEAAKAYAEEIGIGEAGLDRYKAQTREAEAATRSLSKAMAESTVWGDGIAAATTWMQRLTEQSQALELRGVKPLKQVFEFEPDYGMASFEQALQLRASALEGFHAKHAKDITKVLEFHGDPGIGLFQAALDQRAKTIRGTLGAAMKDVPNVIMRALEGGGSVGKSLGGMFGSKLFGADSALVKSLTGGLTKALGKTLGGALGSMLPGLGTALGAGLGALADKVFGKLFGGEGKKVNDLRDQFTSAAGGIDQLAKRAAEAGLTLDRFYKAKTVKEYEAAIAELDAAFKRLDENRQRASTLFDQVMEAGRTGIPAAFQPAIDQLIELGLLTDEQAAKLRGLKDGALDVDQMKADAELFGVKLEDLGAKFQQAQIDETAAKYINALDRLAAGGADMGKIVMDAKEEINALVQQALKSGSTLPENMRHWIDSLAVAGLLLDENGEKITDTSKIKFGEPIKSEADIAREGWEKILEAIQDLVTEIRGPLVDAIDGLPRRRTIEVDVEYNDPGARDRDPGYRVGTLGRHGQWFKNFGAGGTRAILHDWEAVIRTDQAVPFAQQVLGAGASMAGLRVPDDGDQAPLHITVDGEVMAKATIRRVGRRLAVAGV